MKKTSESFSPIHVAFLSGGDEVISGLTWGFIVFAKSETTSALADRRPLLLLLPSVIDLLGGLTAFLLNRSDKQYIFNSDNGCLCVKFFRKHTVFEVYVGHETREANRIANVSEVGLIAAISRALDSLGESCADPDSAALIAGNGMAEIETSLLADYKEASARWRNAFVSNH